MNISDFCSLFVGVLKMSSAPFGHCVVSQHKRASCTCFQEAFPETVLCLTVGLIVLRLSPKYL